ncbi:MAG: hypothetical protein AVDCRST_MAG76-1778 [uncultured Acidimicrobiales bacterium]|uniref:Integral membrane protein n=1 Tax=uncultured Acidimicrobiales bacterium TaxID=310071 RepID=A0A6J4I5P9_9ACTN|nr:MAG: hypothetical protein AVDCRST_MAG76-1778 [uncultured Acidimicrobiales bacterium]
MSLSGVHSGFAWVVIGANAAVGLWALGAHRLPRLRRRALWWATLAAELSVFVEVALGAALVGDQDRQAGQFHAFYGFVAIVAVGVLYSYRSQLRHRIYLLYGLGGLFVVGLAIRAVQIPARP